MLWVRTKYFQCQNQNCDALVKFCSSASVPPSFQVLAVRVEASVLAVRGGGCRRCPEDLPASGQRHRQPVHRGITEHPVRHQKSKFLDNIVPVRTMAAVVAQVVERQRYMMTT